MTRARSIAAIFAGTLAWAATTACNQQTIQTPERSFDRPSDVALTCVQYFVNDNLDVNGNPDPTRPNGTYNVRPVADCETVFANEQALTPNRTVPIPSVGPGNYVPFLVALVPQSARGELAFVDTAQSKLIDLDPFTPDYGFLPVGKLPEHARASSDGCWAVTSNTDSCNLSRVDVSKVIHSSLASLFPEEAPVAGAEGVATLKLSVPSASGTPKVLYSRPSWIEMDAGGTPSEHGYEGGRTHDGFCSGGTHKAWVALPACGIVAKVSLEAADDTTKPTIEQALRVDASGVSVISDLSTIDCPAECGDGSGVSPDGGAAATPSDMGAGNLPSGPWPSTLAIDAEKDVSGKVSAARLIIGDGYGNRVDIVPFDIASSTFGAPASVSLEQADTGVVQKGVRVVRVGPRSAAGKFLYAVARDGTVRVIDLDRNVECETNPDPRWQGPGLNLQQTPTFDAASNTWVFNPPGPRALGCFPLGDPATPRRSPFATTPGIQLTQGQLPTDVAFVHLDTPPGDPTMTTAPPAAAPGLLVGDFAWIVTSDGKGTLVTIYDACPQPNQQQINAQPGNFTKGACIPENVQQSIKDTVIQFGHPQQMLFDLVGQQVRSGHPRFFAPTSESDVTGMPRVPDHLNPCGVSVPSTSPGVPDGGVPDAGACGSNMGNLPSLYVEPVPPELLSPQQQGETRAIYFVDPDHTRNETWVLSWEGVLPGSDRAVGAPFVVADTSAARGGYLADSGGSWCGRGVLAGDKLIFRGCTGDSECDNAGGFQCVHDPGAFQDVTQGMCLHIDNKDFTVDYWKNTCGKLLRSQRKYRVLSARQGATVPSGATGGMTTPMSSSKTDLLKLGEIYEPEFAEQYTLMPPTVPKTTTTCSTDDDCKDIKITTQDAQNPQTRATKCLEDGDGTKRCMADCTTTVSDNECGFDFECARSAFGDLRCMRAPVFDEMGATFWQTCMPELQDYEIHVGDAFTLQGTSSGYLSNEVAFQNPADPNDPGNGECMIPPQDLERVRLAQWRVPLSADACPPNIDAQPLVASIDPAVLQRNVCAVNAAAETTTRFIHFENPIFNIAVQLPLDANKLPFVPPDNTSISIGVTGGGSSLQSLLGVDVQAQQPRYVSVAPDGQTVYIVDEGKSPFATGLRGQLLRLFSASQSVDTTFIVR